MKKFINLAELKLQKTEMKGIVGGGDGTQLLRYAILPLYGIKSQLLYGIIPQPLYGIIPEPKEM